jgi:hypothetical protein
MNHRRGKVERTANVSICWRILVHDIMGPQSLTDWAVFGESPCLVILYGVYISNCWQYTVMADNQIALPITPIASRRPVFSCRKGVLSNCRHIFRFRWLTWTPSWIIILNCRFGTLVITSHRPSELVQILIQYSPHKVPLQTANGIHEYC